MSHTKLRWVGHLFMYVKTYERGRVKLKDFEQRLCVYNAVRYIITLFSRGPRRPRYTGVAVYIT